MPPAITYATHLASYCPNTDDRVVAIDLEDRTVVLVCDGAGGLGGASAAADFVVELVRDRQALVGIHSSGILLKAGGPNVLDVVNTVRPRDEIPA